MHVGDRKILGTNHLMSLNRWSLNRCSTVYVFPDQYKCWRTRRTNFWPPHFLCTAFIVYKLFYTYLKVYTVLFPNIHSNTILLRTRVTEVFDQGHRGNNNMLIYLLRLDIFPLFDSSNISVGQSSLYL